ADGPGDLQCGGPACIFSDGSIRKRDLDHKDANLTNSGEPGSSASANFTTTLVPRILQMVGGGNDYLYNLLYEYAAISLAHFVHDSGGIAGAGYHRYLERAFLVVHPCTLHGQRFGPIPGPG